MCTVSWSLANQRLSLCFNRDERKSRPEALPPVVHEVGGIRVAAPIDPLGGGSWIAVNEKGFCFFILNNYAAAAQSSGGSAPRKSRGRIPMELSGLRSLEALEPQLREKEWVHFNPFILGVASTCSVYLYAWDGSQFSSMSTNVPMVTTSSYKTGEVQEYRENLFKNLLSGRPYLETSESEYFHTFAHQGDAAFNPMMLREESRTHSVTWVEIDAAALRMSYRPTVGETRELAAPNSISLNRS